METAEISEKIKHRKKDDMYIARERAASLILNCGLNCFSYYEEWTMKNMNKFVPLLLGMAGLLVGGSVWANGKGLGIAGSPHDFTDGFSAEITGGVSDETWNNRNEICRVCHVPHDHQKATQSYMNGLLWNHGVSAAVYTMYDASWSSTLNGAQSAQPDGTAKLCLGCHDGTVALDTFDKYAGGGWFMADQNPNFTIPGFADVSVMYAICRDGCCPPGD